MGQPDAEPLDEMDERVLNLLALGMSDVEIAGTLYISDSFAGRLVGQVFRKLGVHKRQQAGMWWIDNGWDSDRRAEVLRSDELVAFRAGVNKLSPRERETLDALVDHPTHELAQLAATLGVSPSTTKGYLEKIALKCNTKGDSSDTQSRRAVLTTRWHLVRTYPTDS